MNRIRNRSRLDRLPQPPARTVCKVKGDREVLNSVCVCVCVCVFCDQLMAKLHIYFFGRRHLARTIGQIPLLIPEHSRHIQHQRVKKGEIP